jgi:hypothetical protein
LNTDGLALFDISFTQGEFIAKQLVRMSMMKISVDSGIPNFLLNKDEGIFDYIYNLNDYNDIDFDGYPDFSNRFYLSGPNEPAVRDFFDDEMIRFFESNLYYHIEGTGNELLVLNRERLASVQELKLFIDFGYRLKELMDRKLC